MLDVVHIDCVIFLLDIGTILYLVRLLLKKKIFFEFVVDSSSSARLVSHWEFP